jgi:hypothetical protein
MKIERPLGAAAQNAERLGIVPRTGVEGDASIPERRAGLGRHVHDEQQERPTQHGQLCRERRRHGRPPRRGVILALPLAALALG